MSAEQGGPAGPAPDAAEHPEAAGDKKAGDKNAEDKGGGGDQPDSEAELSKPPDESARLREATHRPLAEEAPPGADVAASHAVRAGRRTYSANRDAYLHDGHNYYYGQVGDTYHQLQIEMRSRPPLLAGPVPAEQLLAQQEVYSEIPAYAEINAALRATRLVVLCGESGSGRLSTALALLNAIAPGNVARLAPDSDLTRLVEEDIQEGHGYVAEPTPDGTVVVPADVHLDRLSSVLAQRKAYGVLLVSDEEAVDRLLRGRYGHRCLPPRSAEVLASHLKILLRDEPEDVRTAVRAMAERPEVRQALGLAELRPQEAYRLAGLLAQRHQGLIDEDALLAECRTFAPRQVRTWFAGLGRRQGLPEALPALRVAAFRISLAVFNGASYSVVAEAAEALSDELVRELEPDSEKRPGRPLFADDPTARLVAARAELRAGEEEFSGVQLPVRQIWFQGDALASTVLAYVWNRYHNIRVPMVRWLRELGRDWRPLVWARAAVAAGLLVGLDPTYGLARLVQPMARSKQAKERMFAATALDQAARDDRIAPAVRSLVGSWAGQDDPKERWTAAFVHSYGAAAGSVGGSLTQIARIGASDDVDLYAVAGYAAVQLLGCADPGEVLDHIGAWLADDRRDRVDLGLLSAVRMAFARTGALAAEDWKPAVEPERGLIESARTWPVAITLAEVDEQWGKKAADLIWTALDTARSQEAARSAVAGWIREARSNEALLAALERFLPRLVDGRYDLDQMHHLLSEAVEDPDDPLPEEVARRLWRALRRAQMRT